MKIMDTIIAFLQHPEPVGYPMAIYVAAGLLAAFAVLSIIWFNLAALLCVPILKNTPDDIKEAPKTAYIIMKIGVYGPALIGLVAMYYCYAACGHLLASSFALMIIALYLLAIMYIDELNFVWNLML